ncbi:DeoR/GlpR family DNA-binding transcription regulator [Staphylococcus massiliensis]|uniref:DeoR/GlpR family DNA-binding transcription regulator n=1 Tax=Staphylococcus massiliensis TaxID=555791 RepID=UPI001EDDEA72|nr:DeoR/GlpR family DNA-binding transcription regulator [Staphylococcus massiliensis]MCG3401737.1 DeoR/GlpR family DNA-binding transcription regulator [Staphylococcus massiliensis]
MLKEERFNAIVELVDRDGTVQVNDITQRLGVSDMTVRRDLSELETLGLLKRVHGGAKSLNVYRPTELSHHDKQIMNRDQKEAIVQEALNYINEDETIYLGPGTTVHMLAEAMDFKHLRIVTNSLPVFETLTSKSNALDVYLLGGKMRERTQAFNGDITNQTLKNMHFHKAFFSCNALKDNDIMTATIEEGQTQAIAIDNAVETYLLMDASKIGKEDFYTYYQLDDVSTLITDKGAKDCLKKLKQYTQVKISKSI